MGQIKAEIPQSANRNHRLVSEDSANKVLSYLEDLAKEKILIELDETSMTQTDND